MRKVSYLCLQATQQGQASYAHVHEIIQGLQRRDWEVELFEPAYAMRAGSPPLTQKFAAFAEVQMRLWRQPQRPDLVYIRHHPAILPTLWWARARGIPAVVEVNGPYEDTFQAYPWLERVKPWVISAMRKPLAAADALVVVTELLGDWVRREIGDKEVAVIPNGANTELFRPDLPAPIDLPPLYVVFYGALAAWQGIPVLLEAVGMPQWPSDVHLVIAGDGRFRAEVERAARANPKITYLGRVPYHAVPRIVANSIGGLVPKVDTAGHSATGLSPLKLYETAACGVPVVATDFPGQSEFISQYRCGISIPPGDAERLAEAVAHLRLQPDAASAMGRRGREAVERDHSWDRRAEDTSRLLQRLLSR